MKNILQNIVTTIASILPIGKGDTDDYMFNFFGKTFTLSKKYGYLMGGVLIFSIFVLFTGYYLYNNSNDISSDGQLTTQTGATSKDINGIAKSDVGGAVLVSGSAGVPINNREIPNRNTQAGQIKMIGLLPIHSFGGELLFIDSFELDSSSFFRRKTKELSFFLSGVRSEFVKGYKQELITAGWEIQDKPKIAVNSTNANQPDIFYARKNGEIFSITVFEDIQRSTEGNTVLKVSMGHWIDTNILYRSEPKIEPISPPPLPKNEITLEATTGFIEQPNGSLTKVGDSYYFSMNDGITQSIDKTVKGLQAVGYTVELLSKTALQNSGSTQNPSPVIPPIIGAQENGGQALIGSGVIVENPRALPTPVDIFIPFSNIQSSTRDLANIQLGTQSKYMVMKDNQVFEITFAQNIPGNLQIFDNKTIITLRTNPERYTEGIEYFKANTNTYSYSGIVSIANREVFVPYDTARSNTYSFPLDDGSFLPDPVVFSIDNYEQFQSELKLSLQQSGYTTSESILDNSRVQLTAKSQKMQLQITITKSIPVEFGALLTTGKSMVEIVPSRIELGTVANSTTNANNVDRQVLPTEGDGPTVGEVAVPNIATSNTQVPDGSSPTPATTTSNPTQTPAQDNLVPTPTPVPIPVQATPAPTPVPITPAPTSPQ